MGRSLKYEVIVESGGRPEIVQIAESEAVALERAQYLLTLAKYSAVRVVRVNHRGNETTVFERSYGGGGKVTTVSPLDESNICASAADAYSYDSRKTLVRLLRKYCDEQGLIPCQMLHRPQLLRQLEREYTLYLQAVNRLATLQAARLRMPADKRAEVLIGFYRTLFENAKDAEALEPYFQLLAGIGVTGLVDQVTLDVAEPDRMRVITYALSRHLDLAPDWPDKLSALCGLLTPDMPAAAVGLVDEIIAETLDGATPIKAVLGYSPDLATAIEAIAEATMGRLDDRLPGTPSLKALSRIMGRLRLPRTQAVLNERLARTLAGTSALTRLDKPGEAAAFKRLVPHLAEYGGLRGGAMMAEAITRRAKTALAKGQDDLSFEAAIGEVQALLPSIADRVGYLLDLLATSYGQDRATKVVAVLGKLFAAARSIGDFVPADQSATYVLDNFRKRLAQSWIPQDLADRFVRRLEMLALAGSNPGAASAPASPVPTALAVTPADTTIAFAPPKAGKPRPSAGPALTLTYGGREYLFPADAAKFVLGRGSDCDVMVPFEGTSRNHAVVRREGDGFVLTDQSLNGTYLMIDGQAAEVLHAGSAKLAGSGVIFLGADPNLSVEGKPHLIQFKIAWS